MCMHACAFVCLRLSACVCVHARVCARACVCADACASTRACVCRCQRASGSAVCERARVCVSAPGCACDGRQCARAHTRERACLSAAAADGVRCGCTPDDQIVSSCREMTSSPDASTLLHPPARPPAPRSYEVGCASVALDRLAGPSVAMVQPCGESHVEGLGVRLSGKAKL